ncbi:MAG: RimK family protein [Bacteriovoracaceae bacterium]|nr:RimK family protein [Bacteriovoracaceae bacterium]
MKKDIIIVEEKFKDKLKINNVTMMAPMEYIMNYKEDAIPNANVFNLTNTFSYQSLGYYVSLMAMAREHRAFPSPNIIQALKDRTMQRFFSEEFDEKVQEQLKSIKSTRFELSIYLGQNLNKKYNPLSKELYRHIRAPMFRVYFIKTEKWDIDKIKLLQISELIDTHLDFFNQVADTYFTKKHHHKPVQDKYRFDMAILVNPDEKSAPSCPKALQKFVDAGERVGIWVDILTKKDMVHLLEYDALFIRDTTNVNHYTYRMADRARAEGLVVIDDPDSILKCSNKVYLEEMLSRHDLKRPKTMILNEDNYDQCLSQLTFPCVIKQPDSAFSQGVHKAADLNQFLEICQNLFKHSELICVQEYLPTDYDWRVGVLGGEVIYVCKYYMADNHWQIIKKDDAGELQVGNFDCIDPAKTPKNVLKTALKACRPIGNGLYGVDLKQVGNEVYVIEVNDNPSIESGIEDQFAGDKLYDKIMTHFLKQCEAKRIMNVE